MGSYVSKGLSAFAVAGSILLAACSEAPAEKAEKLSLEEFQEKVFWDEVKESPETLSSLRILAEQGITEHNGRLDDLSVAKQKADLERTKKLLQELKAFDDASLTEEQKLNKALMVHSMEQDIKESPYMFHNYPITQLYGWHNNIAGFLTGTHAVTTVEDADYYIARLNSLRGQFNQIMEQLRLREKLGIIPPTFIIEKAEKQVEGFISGQPKENAFYVSFKNNVENIEGISDVDKLRLLQEAAKAVELHVYTIWGELKAYLAGLKARSNNDAGAWKLPDGAAYYQIQLEHYTTTDMTAEEIHNLGLSEVARIQAEMLTLFEAEGYDTSKSFADLINGFAAEERHYYPDTDEGRAQILKDYTAMVDEIAAGISDQFNLKPKAPVEVVRVPVFLEQGAPGGYYNSPALDGSRPGRFYANLYDIKGTPKFGMRALTYHEAVPGHHYQIALQQEQEGLPMFRKFLGYTAYIEGWALYSERVAAEMGFLKTNFDRIGALQSELFRAVRLVVDTGMHAKKWTREEAIDYMASNTGMAMSDVVTEIERYIVWPGQATAYKVGQLSILEMRDNAREKMGDKFDIREFHDLVLKGGSLPLTVLEARVENYINSK
ncbi:DUF885 domain-containing protein [Kordiimonas laminariae]|uniref:DUF885 domain-containing protein n=1 Tax=Kordiimonas laminariae TaxID=2917717 RepID=UPI001FF5C0D1|nr:DUF885 domain-containing protein [Kordiimonas laminariae]MCK0068422.1 DUF885 domain-containing protein [Kordiimonas laminariae]